MKDIAYREYRVTCRIHVTKYTLNTRIRTYSNNSWPPARAGEPLERPMGTAASGGAVAFASALPPATPFDAALARFVAKTHVSNGYGLFRQMTGVGENGDATRGAIYISPYLDAAPEPRRQQRRVARLEPRQVRGRQGQRQGPRVVR